MPHAINHVYKGIRGSGWFASCRCGEVLSGDDAADARSKIEEHILEERSEA